jgi:uncharacterized membrane protein
MTATGFANLHPFFVHAPLVLIPTAAIMVWLGRMIRKDGFDTATFFITVAAALGALAAMASGLWTEGTFLRDQALDELVNKHAQNGIALTVIASVAGLLAVAEWRGWIGGRAWWLRGLLLTWAAIGAATGGHSGARLVYIHGVAVARGAMCSGRNPMPMSRAGARRSAGNRLKRRTGHGGLICPRLFSAGASTWSCSSTCKRWVMRVGSSRRF